MTKKPLITHLLEWTAILTPISAAIAKGFNRDEWAISLLSASITSVAARFIIFTNDWDNQKRRTEAALEVLRNKNLDEHDVEKHILRSLLQSVVFMNNDFDDRVWLELGRVLLEEADEDTGLAIRKALSILKEKEFKADKRRYSFMDAVLRCVDQYRGIAYIEELTNAKKIERAYQFIFELPTLYARKGIEIYRLFVTKNLDELLGALTQEQRESLAVQLSQAKPVQLRWCPSDTPGLDNFGIYGDIALGSMTRGENIIHFNRDRVRNERAKWNTAWELSENRKLTVDILRNSSTISVSGNRYSK